MKYSIVYEIKGEAGAWHQKIAREISEKFGTWKMHEVLPPHITLFYPFETSNIDSVNNFLREITSQTKIPGDFVMSDFDWFPDKAVFATIETTPPVYEAVERIRKGIETIPGMQKDMYPVWHPHATLANWLTPEEISAVFAYVHTLEKPHFILPFDSVTIYQGELKEKRTVIESFLFQP